MAKDIRSGSSDLVIVVGYVVKHKFLSVHDFLRLKLRMLNDWLLMILISTLALMFWTML